MKIEHIAIWTKDLERLREFYIRYFNAVSNEKYFNPKRSFESYFLSFPSGPRLEIMRLPDLQKLGRLENVTGLAHLAFSAGSKENVNFLTELLRKDGYKIKGEPRTTGDGYYESVILDPDGNEVEITE